jgi:hypothetical protein
MTELACLDGPARAAISDRLVAVYRAAMAAPPFFEGVLGARLAAGRADPAGRPGGGLGSLAG